MVCILSSEHRVLMLPGFIVNATVTIKHATSELEEFMFEEVHAGNHMNTMHQVISALSCIQIFGKLVMHR